MIGIDFGMGSIKAVALTGKPGQYELEAMACVPTPKGSIVDHQLQDVDQVVLALKLLRRQLNSRCDSVATAVSGSSVTTRTILVPRSLSHDELETQILLEAEQHIPFPLDEISLDYEVQGVNVNHSDRNNVLLSAARTESINSRVSALEQAGWKTRVVDIGVHALARGVGACLTAEKTEACLLAVVDIGAECLTFTVMDEGEVIYTRLQNFGGAQLSQELASLSDMPADRVEQAKVDNTFPAEVREDIEQLHINTLLQHIRRNIQLFCSSSGNKPPPALFLSGGGSQLPSLAQILQQELSLPVLQPDFGRLFNGVSKHTSDSAAFTTALGLALRSFTSCPI
ncbi:type IV pilus assembly protein PilM [Oceanisphaera sp. KMM 10153]|uniref:type IV pilus assembly protein PilM n=1 Tax=Oceanisphaera submarina TaxID=3390193 RepID=UPI003976A96E